MFSVVYFPFFQRIICIYFLLVIADLLFCVLEVELGEGGLVCAKLGFTMEFCLQSLPYVLNLYEEQ